MSIVHRSWKDLRFSFRVVHWGEVKGTEKFNSIGGGFREFTGEVTGRFVNKDSPFLNNF